MSEGDALTAFITARLDEDEAAARESHYEGQRWLTEEEGVYRWPDDELVHMADRKADARHIARHDPARVLREVAAKRAIVKRYERAMAGDLPEWKAGLELIEAALAILLGALRDLASAWSDHPDYRSEWTPDPGKPVCPRCGTSGCLEDKALDF